MKDFLIVAGSFIGVVLVANLFALIGELVFMIPFLGEILTLGLFAILFWALYKAAISLFDKENN
jgi:hypothetical protein